MRYYYFHTAYEKPVNQKGYLTQPVSHGCLIDFEIPFPAKQCLFDEQMTQLKKLNLDKQGQSRNILSLTFEGLSSRTGV